MASYFTVSQDPPTPTKSLIEFVCGRTQFYDFCINVFQPYQKNHGGSIGKLRAIVTGLATQNATRVLNVIGSCRDALRHKLNQKMSKEERKRNNHLLHALGDCELDFVVVMVQLKKASKNWATRWNPNEVRYVARQSMDAIERCRREFLHKKIEHFDKMVTLRIPGEEDTHRLLQILVAICEVKMEDK